MVLAESSKFTNVLPQVTHSATEDVFVFPGVMVLFGRAKFSVTDVDKVLAVAKKLKEAPCEMEKVTIKASALSNVTGPITVSLEEYG